MPDRWNLDKELSNEELRIIGVEFNVITPNGSIQELAMFVPNGHGLVIPRMLSNGMRSGEYRPTITFHSTVGDYTIGRNDWGCPW